MLQSSIDAVFQSYGRCCKDEHFFETFYRIFINKSPNIAARFDNTDMAAQRQLIRSGLLWLVLYARGLPGSKLEALGKSHSQSGYNIPAHWYHYWEEALIEAVERHDPEYQTDLGQQWRDTLQPGIALMQSLYLGNTASQVKEIKLKDTESCAQ